MKPFNYSLHHLIRPWTCAFCLCAGLGFAADPKMPLVRELKEFGDTSSKALRETYEKAISELRKTGGVLEVPAGDWNVLQKPLPLQGLTRTPAPPEETKRWADQPGVAVLSHNGKTVVLQIPPVTGLRLERPLRLADGDSLPHWGTHPAVTIDSELTYGSTSYLDYLQAPVKKGKDQRFYVATIRGIHPGMFLNLHGGPGYGGGVTRGVVKSIGYDVAKNLSYFVADTDLDHVTGAILHNKSNTGLLHMLQTSHNDNQTYDVKVIRNQYAHGDTYIYYCDFNYMSNIHSAAGDENGNCYAAFLRSMDNNFHSTVESVDWAKSQLVFSNASRNLNTLGDSRPLINLNPKKHLTAGKVIIVAGRTDYDLPDKGASIFEGKDYTTSLVKSEISGATERKFGGLIRGDKDCPWTPEVVGRFFAVADKSELTPKGTFRWYLITKFNANADGTKEIEIQRFWWGAKSAGSPTLYRTDNYTWDGHVRPLSYVIAPGAYVNDVARAIPGGDRGGQRTLGLAAHAGVGTTFDFEKGDAIEQAIGPDPFKPTAMRVWSWEDVPGQFPAAILEAANNGATARYSVVTARGGPANLDDLAKRHEPKPAWDNIMVVDSAATIGLNFKADFARAAILFQQPYHEQPIQWFYGQAPEPEADKGKTGITKAVSSPARPAQVASLKVSRESGEFQFEGGGVRAGGSVSAVAGISGDAKPAKNLRGKNLAVTVAATTLKVKFPTPEADADYAVFLEQSWLGARAITEKTAEGFTVTFDKPAPAKATVDWMLVR
ncbi:MAG: hypothetical protein EB141_04565 [Verrucomicrobia bacterium]|nr:hypothetical protein [Verrucomicrobiota bacterium]NBU07994.1 hypothetical protein [Pseudomonadota bacterium]NDA66244.1 hypothetical protein [Verrucomicrobiota bacterium]NDB74909.1 hypothetical protein [Verrucomicrobiota bacterium]NDD36821.1 hypothetical protein [Verrucomicrobiota bacterium]